MKNTAPPITAGLFIYTPTYENLLLFDELNRLTIFKLYKIHAGRLG